MNSKSASPRSSLPSLWDATAAPAPATSHLEGSRAADVAIVGGGYIGLATALALAEAGKSVVLLEAHDIGWGASGRNGGQVIPGLKRDPDELVAAFGEELGERLVAFSGQAPSVVFDNIARYDIDCLPVRKGWIQPAHTPRSMALLEKRAAQWQRRGVEVSLLDAARTAELVGTGTYCGGWIDHRAGGIQPLSYARGLARAALARGARIFTQSPATNLGRSGSSWRISTPKGEVVADQVLLCTNAYSGTLGADLQRTIITPNSFQIATRPLEERIRRTILPQGHVASDARRLLLYYRLDEEGRLLVGGRGTFRDPDGPASFGHLRRALALLFPQAADAAIEYYWGGRVAITLDDLPHVHRLDDGLVAVLGCNGRGVALTSALGPRIAAWLQTNDDAEIPFPLSRPRSIPFHQLQTFYVAGASAWFRLRDWMS